MVIIDFFFYCPKLAELGSVGNIAAWLRDKFNQYGYSSPEIEVSPGGPGGSFISICEPGLFRAGLHLESGRQVRYLNTTYCLNYLDLPKKIIDQIKDADRRLDIQISPENDEYPEDCVDFTAVFSEIEGGCLFGPREYHVRKMKNIQKNVTRNWVTKQLLPKVTVPLENQGFVADGLSFEHPDGRNLLFDFMTKADYEFSLCTRGSFQVVAFKGWNRRVVPAQDNCLIWYVQPDGSNIDEQLDELSKMIQEVDASWWEWD